MALPNKRLRPPGDLFRRLPPGHGLGAALLLFGAAHSRRLPRAAARGPV